MEHKRKFPQFCPCCQSSLHVVQLECKECSTQVNGRFELPLLAQFTESDMSFIVEFVKSSGSLKDMARQLGVSYPTVRNMLDEIIEKLNNMDNDEK